MMDGGKMAFPTKIPKGKQLQFQKVRIPKHRGLDMSKDQSQLDIDQSPYMRNCFIDEGGAIKPMLGSKLIHAFGAGPINGLMQLGQNLLVVHDNKIYKFTDDGTITELYTSVDARHRAFEYDSKLFILNGSSYLQYDGNTVAPVEGKIPTLTIGTPAEGGGTTFEQRNIIQPKFKQSFNGDNTKNDYQLLLKDLDSETVTATVDGNPITEGSGLTVDRATGIVTILSPTTGVDNIIIQAAKTITETENYINNCTFAVVYGGQQDFKVYVSGNPNLKNRDWGSGALDPTYFPDLSFDNVGFDDQAITGYNKMNDSLLIYKYNEDTKKKSMFVRDIVFGEDVTFRSKPINDERGAFNPDVTQVLNGVPVSIDNLGGFEFTNGQVRDERNVNEKFTERINYQTNSNYYPNKGILEGGHLVTEEYDRKLWISDESQSLLYIYDWVIKEFYLRDGIKARVLKQMGSYLYFGDSDGNLKRFFVPGELNPYQDNGVDITAEYYSINANFLTPEIQDQINSMFVTLLPFPETEVQLWTRTNKASKFRQQRANNPMRILLFNYGSVNYGKFTYGANEFPQTLKANIKAKKVNYFQWKYVSVGLPFVIAQTELKILAEREVKR